MENFIVNVLLVENMWIARCDELGVVTEADEYEELLRRTRILAAELHKLNGMGDASFQLSFLQLIKPILSRHANVIKQKQLKLGLQRVGQFIKRGPIFHEIWQGKGGGYFCIPSAFKMVQTAEEAINHAQLSLRH